MPNNQRMLFNAFGPRVPLDFRETLFPVPSGKDISLLPGSRNRFIGNVMQAGSAGNVCHLRLLDPIDEKIKVRGRVEDPEGILFLVIQLSGTSETTIEKVKGTLDNHEQKMACYTYKDQVMESVIHICPSFENIGFSYSGSFLINALEDGRAPKILTDLLKRGLIEKSTITDRPCTPHMMRIIRDVINHPYHGAAEMLFLQGKMLELLAELTLADPDDRKTPGKPDEASYVKACHARDILLLDPRNPPDPMELGRMVGASYRTINRAFVKYFGQTAYRFARDAALALAKEELESKGLTVAEAAYKFGYSHPSAFIAAYRRRFGQSPGGKQSGPGAGK